MYQIPDIALSFLTPLIELMFFAFLTFLTIYLHKKKRGTKIIPMYFLITLITIIIGVISIQYYDLPFTPWIQVFFILFQVIYLVIVVVERSK